MNVLSLAAVLAASLPGRYECTIANQAIVTEAGAEPGAAVQFPGMEGGGWRFSPHLRERANAASEVEVRWPANPIQIAGTHAALDVAPDHVVFLAMARGPCMFTELNCASLIQLSTREDGSAAFTIMPAGLARDASGVSSQFHVIFTGTCRRQGGA